MNYYKLCVLLLLCLAACVVLAQEEGSDFVGSVDSVADESEAQHVDIHHESEEGAADNVPTAVEEESHVSPAAEAVPEQAAPVPEETGSTQKRRNRFAPSQEEASAIPTRPVAKEHTEASVPTRTHAAPEVHPEVINSLVDNVKGEMSYKEITEEQWKSEVYEYPGPVAMLVYNSDNCKGSSNALTEFEYAARVLKDKIKCVTIEGMIHHGIRGRYSIQAFPHMRLYGVERGHPIPYQTGHTNATYVKVLSEFADSVRAEEGRNAARRAAQEEL